VTVHSNYLETMADEIDDSWLFEPTDETMINDEHSNYGMTDDDVTTTVNNNNNNNNASVVKTIDPGDALANSYQRIETYRIEADFFYAFFDTSNIENKNMYLKTLVSLIRDVHGVHRIPGGIDDDDMKVMKEIVSGEDMILKDALWFMALANMPQLMMWFREGDPAQNKAPPPLANKERFELFVRSTVRQAFGNLISGNSSLENFARELRCLYLVVCGAPMPPELELHYGYTREEMIECTKHRQ
jgi:hypothetical protein